MADIEKSLWEWALAHRAQKNPSPLYEAVLIARIQLPETLQGHCFGVMLAETANHGGSIITCAQSFPEGETHELGYVRIWEPIAEQGVLIRPINKVVPVLQETYGLMSNRQKTRELFEGPIDMVDLAVATGTKQGALVPTTGFSRIGGTTEQRQMGLFRDLHVNPQTALNLVTGQRVSYVAQSEVEHGFTFRALATPFERVHQGVPYLHDDGTISISKGRGSFDLVIGDKPPQRVELTIAIAFKPNFK